jgi:ATP-dependent DNA helicase PIF1
MSISIDDGDRKMGKMSNTQKRAWTDRRYMVIDEVSMLNCKVMELLHRQLATTKANPELPFGGVNLIFLSDFLQIPAVQSLDVYVDDRQYRLGHRLWRSLNAVVNLREQMRQAGDPLYARILSRVRLRILTDEDIEILRS